MRQAFLLVLVSLGCSARVAPLTPPPRPWPPFPRPAIVATATLPTSADAYFGFILDKNNDGIVDGMNDEAFAFHYVDSSDGKIHQLRVATGVDEKQADFLGGAQAMGTPTINTTAGRLHVGAADGRLCAFTVPFP